MVTDIVDGLVCTNY